MWHKQELGFPTTMRKASQDPQPRVSHSIFVLCLVTREQILLIEGVYLFSGGCLKQQLQAEPGPEDVHGWVSKEVPRENIRTLLMVLGPRSKLYSAQYICHQQVILNI